MTELEGQMALFDLDEAQPVEACEGCPECDDELCEECGTHCTSSKECVEISGLYDAQARGDW